ncbi:docking protein 3 [Mastacembelus armatus]|uniref:docking protein 3 n=1 Tax=Mastacembelus armatus TaxID=205130 RepID=UPI000E46009F|nr:docking protein 3 [Mastacembelus armatus]
MDVVFKEGMLYLQGVKFGKRTWRKIRMILFKPSSTGVGRLELHTVIDTNTDQKKINRLKTPDRKVVRLSDCLSVTTASQESCPQGCTAFYLSTTQCTYTLASTTSQEWLSALCLLAFQKYPGESDKGGLERGNDLTMADNDIYSSWKTDLTIPPNHYEVTVQTTEASKRCRLAGEYLVSPRTKALLLLATGTRHVIYRWPYSLLRKFGQVQGGFSIEAGRRCESGEGVFTFLTTHGALIFQAISEQCSVERRSSVQLPSVNIRSLCDQSPVTLPDTPYQLTGPPVYSPADVPADTEDVYTRDSSIIDDASGLDLKQLSSVKPHLFNSREAVGEEDEDEDKDDIYHSLEALKLENDNEQSIYCNLGRAILPLSEKDQFKSETDDYELFSSDVKSVHPPLNLQLQPYSTPLPQPTSWTPPCTLPLSVSNAIPKPRYQHQTPVNNYILSGSNAETEAVDDMDEMEEAINSSTNVTPTELPGSFKHRLAEIISKDLAKFQQPLPYGAGSPTFSQ